MNAIRGSNDAANAAVTEVYRAPLHFLPTAAAQQENITLLAYPYLSC